MAAPMLDRFEIARALREIALLLELKGENSFKIKAYQNGAEALENMPYDLAELVETRRLTSVRGIGEALAAKITEVFQPGRCEFLDKLRAELPPGVVELSQVPGLSTKKIQALHDALKISSIAELQAACKTGMVATIPGFGQKTQEKILQAIESFEQRVERQTLVDALELAETITSFLKSDTVVELQAAGSVRRWQETAGDINFVACTADSGTVIEKLTDLPMATRTDHQSDYDARVRLANGCYADIVCVPEISWGVALARRTGSWSHVHKLEKVAHSRGYELTERALLQDGQVIPCPTEDEFYRRLGMTLIPPELREDIGEIEAAQNNDPFDDLIETSDIRGMVHCHTNYSDGKHTVEEMAKAAEKLGMEYITITDHSPTAHYAGGVDVERLKRQWDEIARVQETVKVKILRGTESDILENGALDYPDHILDQFDVVIASIHSRMKMDEEQMTRRLVNCMKEPHFKIWGHPLGR
ncbi:MAG TPA: PHP domain-containing protein, partial [Chroococcales cyanobacterium]